MVNIVAISLAISFKILAGSRSSPVALLGLSLSSSLKTLWLPISDFLWPFLTPYMGVIPNPKMVFIFPISCILVLIFPFL